MESHWPAVLGPDRLPVWDGHGYLCGVLPGKSGNRSITAGFVSLFCFQIRSSLAEVGVMGPIHDFASLVCDRKVVARKWVLVAF